MKTLLDIMDIILNISWVANIAAVIASTLIGIIWFHPQVFGTAWMQLVKLKKTCKYSNSLESPYHLYPGSKYISIL